MAKKVFVGVEDSETGGWVKVVYYKSRELPLCPRCNHRHRLMVKNGKITPMDKCPYCNCPLHYDLLEEEYVL